MGHYQVGIGVEPSDVVINRPSPTLPASRSDYVALANAAAIETPGTFVLVTVADDGHVRTFNKFGGSDLPDIKEAYAMLVTPPQKSALVAYYDRTPKASALPSGLMDSTFRPLRTSTVTIRPKKSILPALGLGVAGVLGVVAVSKKGKR